MIENIKYRLWSLLIFCLRKIMEMLFFIYEIIRYPIKNISIWLAGILSFVINENIEIELKGKEMFFMSVGLVSIMTFISNFLEKQTIDIENKDNFYLGHNIKKLKFHDNFWLKRFNEFSSKLLFWIVAAIPFIVICTELKYNSKILNEISEIITTYIKYIDSIWLGAFMISSFYCTALLIESVALSSKNFSQSYLYKTTNKLEKFKIRLKIEQEFKKIFNNIFNIKSILELESDFYGNVERAINYIINRGNVVSSANFEIIEFYDAAFKCEGDKIDKLLNKAYRYAKCDENKKIKYSISAFLFSKFMHLLSLYYNIKWNTLIQLDVLPLGIIDIAIQDLNRLLEIEKKLCQNKEYKNIFWGMYTKNKYYLFSEDKAKSNLCISRICEILEEKFRDINFLNQYNDIDRMMKLFDVLNRVDSQTKDERYFSPIFKILFEHIIDERSNENDFVKLFYDSMKNKYLPEYLISERKEVSKNILLSGNLIANNILEYLLDFMQLEDIIVVLIFRLAYSERSGRKIMTIDEFKVWENVINKLIVRKDIDNLKESKFIDELCCEISKSHVSHFVFEQFIKWMWFSLFERFDENRYEEFIKLGEEGIRRNFSLDSYIIVRLLLCNYSYRTLWVFEFKEENKKQIENELCSIKNILNIKGVHI